MTATGQMDVFDMMAADIGYIPVSSRQPAAYNEQPAVSVYSDELETLEENMAALETALDRMISGEEIGANHYSPLSEPAIGPPLPAICSPATAFGINPEAESEVVSPVVSPPRVDFQR